MVQSIQLKPSPATRLRSCNLTAEGLSNFPHSVSGTPNMQLPRPPGGKNDATMYLLQYLKYLL